MNARQTSTLCSLFALTICLSGCGGGGGGGIAAIPPPPPAAVAPTPAPTPAPPPPPPPPATSVLRPELIALEPDDSFVTLAVTETDTLSTAYDKTLVGSKDNTNILSSQPSSQSATASFRFNPSTWDYSISFPDGTSGTLVLEGLSGSVGEFATSTSHRVVGPQGDLGVLVTMPVPHSEYSEYTYSHYGAWSKTVPNPDGSAVQTYGLFVYGYTTPSAGVPRSGSATYSANIIANSPADPWEVTGTVNLAFDFGAGTLSGSMHPVFDTNGWYPSLDYDYGRYDFAQTIYAVGSAAYSGQFARNGVTVPGSWFDGTLTGPGVQETIGRFAAPFSRGGIEGTLTGVWIGKRD